MVLLFVKARIYRKVIRITVLGSKNIKININEINIINLPKQINSKYNQIFVDSQNQLMIATGNQGIINYNIVHKTINFITKSKNKEYDIIEIHNRPNYVKYIKKEFKNKIILYFQCCYFTHSMFIQRVYCIR